MYASELLSAHNCHSSMFILILLSGLWI